MDRIGESTGRQVSSCQGFFLSGDQGSVRTKILKSLKMDLSYRPDIQGQYHKSLAYLYIYIVYM